MAIQSGVFSSVSGLLKTATGSNQRAEKKARATKTSPADVVGCSMSDVRYDDEVHGCRRFLGVGVRIPRPARIPLRPASPREQ